MTTPHLNKKAVLTRMPLHKLNKKLSQQLNKHGFKNIIADFEAVDPLGDFVEDPSLPIPVLIVADTGKEHSYLRPMCILGVDRKLDMKTWWMENGAWLYQEILPSLKGSLEKQKIEEQQLLEKSMSKT